MTEPGSTTEPGAAEGNYAGDFAHVGVQATTVHGDVNYYSSPVDASPKVKFATGVRLLEGGMPGKARQLIHEAVVDGHTGNKVCFHWQLALLSGRTWHEMPHEDIMRLRQAPTICRVTAGDSWADGVEIVHRLLNSVQQGNTDPGPLLKDFDELYDPQRAMILRHLELFLDGPLKNQMWHRALQDARRDQMDGDRADRVWKFFHPEPANPRQQEPRPPNIPVGTWVRAVVATVVLAVVLLHIGYLLVRGLQVYALAVYLLSIAGGCLAARGGLEWRFRTERCRAKDQEYAAPRTRTAQPPPGGFANKVDQSFRRYFGRYVPRQTDRATWLAETAGIRKSLRDEIVEVYREQRIGVERISWLIRYRVSEVRKQWENGTLFAYRYELATPLSTKILTLIGLAITVFGGSQVMESAMRLAPLSAARSTALALAAGVITALAWQHIILEYRRYAADKAEATRTQEGCQAAYERWKQKLADKPTDLEMAAWLDRDRKVLLNEALRHYGLSMSDIIAHAFIETPGPRTKRARVQNGPWRYSRYRLFLFLLTSDGIRQLSSELDFERGTLHGWNRVNYRYEAVAAVRVHQPNDDECRFELTLVNGEQIKFNVLTPGQEELQMNEAHGAVSEVTLDAAGFHHTLHVMEGIAAEGKQWIKQERRRQSKQNVA
ncbi:hypothetical protein [Actinocorallia libanotica]|uniref:Uncharacterized protein n=1 Tax=Actinocorallia libanotica TaxID=46162 RepID=A0ABP4B795_9ACTN